MLQKIGHHHTPESQLISEITRTIVRTLRATKPERPYTAAITGIVGAAAWLLLYAHRKKGPDVVRREAEAVAAAIMQTTEYLMEDAFLEGVH